MVPNAGFYEAARKSMRRKIERMSETNRSLFEDYLLEAEGQGLKPTTLNGAAEALLKWDGILNGVSASKWTPALLTQFMVKCRERKNGDRTIEINLKHLRRFYIAKSRNGRVPAQMDRIWRLHRKARKVEKVPVSEKEFDALMAVAHHPRDQASLAVLRDAGIRIHEFTALRNRDYFRDDRGRAWLRLPPDAEGLKTGPRDISILACVPALDAWKAVDPTRDVKDAPLFHSVRRLKRVRSMHAQAVNKLLADLSLRAGLGRRIHPHLLRHTRITETSRKNWHFLKQCKQFGWTKASKMPAEYSHLTGDDVADQVHADAEPPKPPEPVAPPPAPGPSLEDAVRLLSQGLASALRPNFAEPASTVPTPVPTTPGRNDDPAFV